MNSLVNGHELGLGFATDGATPIIGKVGELDAFLVLIVDVATKGATVFHATSETVRCLKC